MDVEQLVTIFAEKKVSQKFPNIKSRLSLNCQQYYT